MTIAEAARDILRRHGRPMTIDEIYTAIIAEGLAEFNTAQPRGVLRNQMRRHCEGIHHAAPAKLKYFAKTDGDRFVLLS